MEWFFLWRMKSESVCQNCGHLELRFYREFRRKPIPLCPICGGHVRAPEADERDALSGSLAKYGVNKKRRRYKTKKGEL